MNPPPTQTAPLPFDPIHLAVMVRATVDAIPHHPDAPPEEQAARCQVVFAMIEALRPRDVLEAMIAARLVAVQFHIMDTLRCAAESDVPPALKLRYRASAAALNRMQDGARRELTRLQAFPALQPAALPVAVPAPRAAPTPEAALASTPPRPVVEGRHARRVRERAERHAAAVQRAGLAAGGPGDDVRKRLLAEVAARAAASITALAA